MARQANADTIEAAARRLGLAWSTGPFQLRGVGVVDGVPLVFEWVTEGIQGAVEVRTAFDPPLALDLRVRSIEGAEQRMYQITSSFMPTAEALLSPGARAHFSACSWGAQIDITDAGLVLHRSLHGPVDANDFEDDVRAVAAAVRQMDEARRTAPVMTALERHARVLAEYAAQNRLSTRNVPPSAFGPVARGSIAIVSSREPHGYGARARFAFAQGLHVGLDLVPAAALPALSRMWASISGRDVKVGDDAFDAMFVVRTERPEVIATVLDAEVRAALLEAHARFGALHLLDGSLTIGPAPLDDARPEQLIDLATCTTALGARLAPSPR